MIMGEWITPMLLVIMPHLWLPHRALPDNILKQALRFRLLNGIAQSCSCGCSCWWRPWLPWCSATPSGRLPHTWRPGTSARSWYCQPNGSCRPYSGVHGSPWGILCTPGWWTGTPGRMIGVQVIDDLLAFQLCIWNRFPVSQSSNGGFGLNLLS